MNQTEPETTEIKELGETRAQAKRELFEFAKMILWFLVLFFGLRLWVVEGYEVQGPSMDPTLHDRERILVWKLPQVLSHFGLFNGIDTLEPHDIVVFRSSDVPTKPLVKRVIAEGPPARHGKTVQAGQTDNQGPAVTVRFETGSIYVDNRRLDESYLTAPPQQTNESHDPVTLHEGEYYVLGDNRGVSKDSRAFGIVKDSQIIGKAIFRFWPISRIGLLK